MRDDPITRLAAANPVPHDGPLRALEAQGHGRRRRRVTLGIVVAVCVIAAVLVATPAWALVRDVLPFWDQPSAPPRVMVQFSEEAMGAPNRPPRLNPRADAGSAREIMQADFGGETHTLYVAPARNNEFAYCAWWSPYVHAEGCRRAFTDETGFMGVHREVVFPHDASRPARHPATELQSLGQRRVPYWLLIDADPSTVANVEIHFSDGTTVQPEITWVSAPINAGFAAYQVPNDKQSATDHVTEVDAYDSDGNLIERNVAVTAGGPTGSATTGR
jgi:hypothetical protein